MSTTLTGPVKDVYGRLMAGRAPDGRRLSPTDRVHMFRDLVASGHLQTLAPALPLLLNLKGAPYTLRDHAPFEDLFRFKMPMTTTLLTARQVSKSTSQASHGIIQSVSIPNKWHRQPFSILYVTPLFEQIRRFSAMYVQPFIDTSPVKRLWADSSTVNSVLHKSFKNGSQMLFSYALLSADRIRGISSDCVAVDESVCKHTYVNVLVNDNRQQKQIQHVRPGDLVLSYDMQGKLLWSPVVSSSPHGNRPCFRIRTRGNREIIATAEHRLATNTGWRTVSQIIDAYAAGKTSTGTDEKRPGCADREAAAATARYAVRRRLHAAGPKQQSTVQFESRLAAGGIQLDQVHRLVAVRKHASREEEEQRLRQVLECVRHVEHPGIPGNLRDHVPQSPQARYARMVECDRNDRVLGVPWLVAWRRRQSPGYAAEPIHAYTHGGFRSAFRDDAAGVVGRPQYEQQHNCDQQSIAGQALSHSQFGCRLDAVFAGQRHTTRTTADTIQSRASGPLGDMYLHLLRGDIRTCEVCEPGPKEQTVVLQQSVLSATSTERNLPQERKQTRDTRADPQETASALLQRPGRKPQKVAGISQEVHGKSSRRSQREEEGESHTESTGIYLLGLPYVAQEDWIGPAAPLLPYLSSGSDPTDKAKASREAPQSHLTCDEIVSIEYVGHRDVWDIEVTGTHTYVANGLASSNCQDMDRRHLPIIAETMSYSKWALRKFTGTPKTLDNTIHGLWEDSSQAEWFVPCFHCTTNGRPTQNIPSAEFHLLDMIGPWHTDISEKHPATLCYKCRQPISPRFGRWVHRYEDRRWRHAGYHVPQLLMPLHFARPTKWSTLLAKQQGKENTPTNVFFNEVLGESYDTASKLVTLTELQRVSDLWPLDETIARQQRGRYQLVVMAADWGGGGEDEVSFTTIALLGLRYDGQIDVIWGKRLLTPHDHIREARDIVHYWNLFRPAMLIHDYTGAGSLRETFLIQAGLKRNQVMPCQMVRSASRAPCYHVAPSEQHPRDHYRVDKARTLQLTCAMIKLWKLHFFHSDYVSDDDRGLIRDFLALTEEKVQTQAAGEVYRIGRAEGFTDDFAQAVNLGCVGIWYRTRKWPNIAEIAAAYAEIAQPLTKAQEQAMGPAEPQWDGLAQD